MRSYPLRVWLNDLRTRLDESLDQVLDVDSGLAEARLPGLQHTLVDVLEDVVDVESGLAAIVGGARPDRFDVRGGCDLSRFADGIAVAPPGERLAARRWLPLAELSQVGKVAGLEVRALQVARELEGMHRVRHDGDSAFDIFTSALGDQRHHATQIINSLYTEARGDTATLALTTAITRDPDLDHDRSYAVEHALIRARTLERHLSILQTSLGRRPIPSRSWASDRQLGEACMLARLLDHALTGALARCLDHTRHCVRDETMRQVLAGDLTQVLALDLVQDADAEERDRHRAELVRSIVGAVDDVVHAATQVIGVDVSNVDLRDIPLEGLRWSSTTRWPPDWADWVHRNSVTLGRDLFAIRAGTSDVDAAATAMA